VALARPSLGWPYRPGDLFNGYYGIAGLPRVWYSSGISSLDPLWCLYQTKDLIPLAAGINFSGGVHSDEATPYVGSSGSTPSVGSERSDLTWSLDTFASDARVHWTRFFDLVLDVLN